MEWTFNPFTGNFDQSGGISAYARVATLVVAASNAKDTSNADYVCTGTNDDVQIAAAIAALPASGGRVILTEGLFTIGSEINISSSNVILEGQGQATTIKVKNSGNIRSCVAITGTGTVYVKLKNFIIDGNKANQTSGNGIYIKTPGSSFSGHVLEDILVQNCKNDGFKTDNNAGTSSVYFLRCHASTCNGNGFNIYQDSINGASLTDSVFDTCIAETNALNGFYIGCIDTHFTNCKSYYNGSATGNYHGYYIAGYNNYFISSEAQDNYQSGFYSQNDGDATYGAQNCIFVDCDADSNNQSLNASYGVGFQLKNVTGWMLFGCQAYTRPYPSFTQRLGVSLEGTTNKTQITNLQGTGNSGSLYSNTSSGSGNVLYGLNAAGSRITIDGGTNDLEFDNLPELFWNQTNPDISLYNASDNRLDILNAGGGKGNLNIQNQLTFGYGDYLGVSPTSSWPLGTHKLLEVTYNGSTDQLDVYTPGSTLSTSLITLTADKNVKFNSNVNVKVSQGGTFRLYSDGSNGLILDGSLLVPSKNVWNMKQGSDGTFLFDQGGGMSGRFKLGGTGAGTYFDWTPDYSNSYFKVQDNKAVLTFNNTLDNGSGGMKIAGNLQFPSAGAIIDANGNNLLVTLATVASSVDYVTLTNSATGNPALVGFSATGSDANIHFQAIGKGNGLTKISVLRQNNTTNSYKHNTVILTGWNVYTQGAASNKSATVTYGITFAAIPITFATYAGDNVNASTTQGSGGNSSKGPVCIKAITQSTTQVTIQVHTADGTSWGATDNVFYNWMAIGEL